VSKITDDGEKSKASVRKVAPGRDATPLLRARAAPFDTRTRSGINREPW
jgi:hypothetical protein